MSFNSMFESGWLVVIAEATLKGTILLVCAAALTFALRNARASVRHLVWSLALVAMMSVPLLSFVMPQWSLPLIPRPLSVSVTTEAGGLVAGPRRDLPVQSVDAVGAASQSAADRAPTSAPAVDPNAPAVPGFRLEANSLASMWLAGVLACLTAVVFGLAGLRFLKHRSTRISDPRMLALVTSLKQQLGLEREVRLMQSNRATMPATWGIANPVILLPADALDWTEERKRVVLMHELAHIKRQDCLTQLIAQICCAVYWFHPGVWYIARRMRAERELACDEQVLMLGVNACDYADHLLQITRAFRTPIGARMAAVAMARPSQLEGRLVAILSGDVTRSRSAKTLSRAAVSAILLAITLPLAAMRPWRSSPAAATLSPASTTDLLEQNDPAQLRPVVAVGDTFRWSARTFQGQWIEIHANVGEIRAIPADGNELGIVAVRRTPGRAGDSHRLNVDTRRAGFSACVLPVTSQRKSCEDAFLKTEPGSGVRYDFLVRVPAGVGFAGHTVSGNVSAEDLKSYAWATTVKGDISIVTTDLAEASSKSGDISAIFGRANWKSNLEFETDEGDVTVMAPSNASAMVQAQTGRGRVTSEFPLPTRNAGDGDTRVGRIGTGRGMLTVRTGRGNVELKRGPAGVVKPFRYEDAPSSSADPKPNPNYDPDNDPNPDPAPDPNPNPNPASNPNPYPLPSWRGPGSGDLAPSVSGGADNPTGEKVPFTAPTDLIRRVSDAQIQSAPDRAAIVRLRDIAVTHNKQHAADLVKERSLWALSLVSNGRIVQPLANALSSSDWRVRAYAAWALSHTGEHSAQAALGRAVTDEHWRVRMHAVYGLERSGPAAMTQLVDALRDPYWQVRIGAVDALTTIGNTRALQALRTMRDDSHPLVREEVLQALNKLER